MIEGAQCDGVHDRERTVGAATYPSQGLLVEARRTVVAVGKSVDVDFRTGAKLEDVWVEKRKNEQLGIDQSWEWVKVKYADGSTEDANNKERPAELPKR